MDMCKNILDSLKADKRIKPNQLSGLSLAFIGDTVYDLYVRTLLVSTRETTVHSLHMLSSASVCARGQREAFFKIDKLLTEEELAVFKRGRNAHSGTVPKNADVTDYRIATGFECLIGYLYLSGQIERLNYLMQRAFGIEE